VEYFSRQSPFTQSQIAESPVDNQQLSDYIHSCCFSKGERLMVTERAEVLQGTLDLMVLKTLETMGPMHGFGIARRIEQVSENLLQLNQGTLYPALIRLQQKGWIASKEGVSENNRRARFYSLTAAGRRQLKKETENWERMTALIARLLAGNA
jgi:PadR family transcriptional regulator PadR